MRDLETVLVIPAAGAGTRLQSSTPKVLSAVNGRPMIDHLIARYRDLVRKFVLVVHPSFSSIVKDHVQASAPGLDVAFAEQPAPTGMLDAILIGCDLISREKPERVWVTWCDQIGVHPQTVATLSRISTDRREVALILPTSTHAEPYIHLERNADGAIVAIRQRREGDPMPPVGESDMGLFSLSPHACFDLLTEFGRETTQGTGTRERNFLPFMPWLAARGETVLTFPSTTDMEALGVNTPEDRSRLERYLREIERG